MSRIISYVDDEVHAGREVQYKEIIFYNNDYSQGVVQS